MNATRYAVFAVLVLGMGSPTALAQEVPAEAAEWEAVPVDDDPIDTLIDELTDDDARRAAQAALAEPEADEAGPPADPPAEAPQAEAPPASSACGVSDEMKAEMLRLVNEARSSARTCGEESMAAAPGMAWDDRLGEAARRHADDMARANFFSHRGSDGSSFGDRARAAGYPMGAGGENISAGRATARDAVEGWLKSAGHCRNMMSPRYTRIGAACAANPESQWKTYWVQVFGDGGD